MDIEYYILVCDEASVSVSEHFTFEFEFGGVRVG